MVDSDNNNKDIIKGLSSLEVEEKIKLGQVNKTKMIAGKTVWEILRTDVFSFFNIMLFSIFAFMLYANSVRPQFVLLDFFFMGVLGCNIIIGLYQDFKAKHLMKKLKVITTPMCRVIRDGQEVENRPSEIVLGDIVVLKAGEQVPSDSELLDTKVQVNESMLTGESHNVEKNIGDLLYSGSFITSGNCYAEVVKVGKDNYIETITEKAKAFKRNPSHILKGLKVLFRYLGIIIICFFITAIAVYASFGGYKSWNEFIIGITSVAPQMIAMIPSGLYLLTSMALATGVLSLFKKKANVQDFYSIEMLARSDVICVDKTGTITDGNLSVVKIDNVSKMSDEEIGVIIHSLVAATGDENVTAKALLKEFENCTTLEVQKVLPFSSDNKYSGVSMMGGTTYLIGAFEFMNIKNKDVVSREAEQYASEGFRVLALTKGISAINGDSYKGEVELVAFIVLQDHVKDDAKETFEWFQSNGVQVKVISGDNALTVSEVARSAGIEGAEKYVSLEGMSIKEVKKIADEYVVFGRVTPEQKEALVMALKAKKHTVAMVGDGVNDMLALKRADCSIAMNSGSLSARNVSHVVLMDDNFSTMPSVVGEGRRVINNLERTGSLFLTKTIFAMVMSLVFLIITAASKSRIVYSYQPSNLFIWEVLGIGLSAFFIALEPDSKPIKKGFLRNMLIKAAPFAGMVIISTLLCYLLFIFQDSHIFYTGIVDSGFRTLHMSKDYADLLKEGGAIGATAMSILVFSLLSIFVLFMTCRPLTLYRGIVCGASAAITLTIIAVCAFTNANLIKVNFSRLTGENIITIVIIVLAAVAITLLTESIIAAIKIKDKKEEVEDED